MVVVVVVVVVAVAVVDCQLLTMLLRCLNNNELVFGLSYHSLE